MNLRKSIKGKGTELICTSNISTIVLEKEVESEL